MGLYYPSPFVAPPLSQLSEVYLRSSLPIVCEQNDAKVRNGTFSSSRRVLALSFIRLLPAFCQAVPRLRPVTFTSPSSQRILVFSNELRLFPTNQVT